MSEMYVINRKGDSESVRFDKINDRIKNLAKGLSSKVNPDLVSQKTIESLRDGMATSEIDVLSAEVAATLSTEHQDYNFLASRILISNLHKNTSDDFCLIMQKLNENIDKNTGKKYSLISDEVIDICNKNKKAIMDAIDYERDYMFDYFGLKALFKGYLNKIDGKIEERPQHMFMRVAIGVNGDNISEIIKTYDLMSRGIFTHATPTLFNSGTPYQQMSSCFLLAMTDDSIDGIYDTLKRCAQISKYSGGIGLSVHNIRSSGSAIVGNRGVSTGLVPMLRVYNATAVYVKQGGGKRKGAFAIYIEPWHKDIFSYLDLRKNHGVEEMRARDLFLGLWIPDLFMKRVENQEHWTLMSPDESPGLYDVYGEEFEELYEKYEKEGKGKKIDARELWFKIIEAQIETGLPYMLYKDSINKKSNQKNLGTIRSSNLCTEIMEYTSPEEVAVCNLASIALPKFVKEDRTFDYQSLYDVTKKITKNLNDVIDRGFYPVKEAEYSNLRHRPIGIGVQGLADVFFKLRIPYTSSEAKKINREIFETIYYAALTSSNEIAKKEGPYKTYKGSPISKGIFQFEMWDVKEEDLSGRWNWSKLRKSILEEGVRNSLLIAPMPTATTAHILGNIESFEPLSSNLYVRRTLAGEFIVVNKYLIKDLIDLGLWNEKMRQALIRHNGSIQEIEEIPENIRQIYKTVWEISMKDVIDMSKDRAVFIDQSQSLNMYMASPSFNKITSMHFYAWKQGLKTGMYYFRTKSAVDAIKFSISKSDEARKDTIDENLRKEAEDRAISLLQNKGEEVSINEKSQRSLIDDDEDEEDPNSPPNTCTSCGS